MQDNDESEVLAVVEASPGRRWLGIVSLGVMGVLLIWVAFARPPEPLWQLFLLVIGALALWCAEAMRRATSSRLELTEEVLRDGDGTVITPTAEIAAIDRGFFAFKPSNGFLIRTRDKAPRRWRPGMWWRVGRQIGVGGMTPGHQSKNMAEIIAIMLARRDGL